MIKRTTILLTLLIIITLVMFFGYSAEAQTGQVLEVGTPLFVTTQVGSDGLFYLQCDSGCATFYEIAPINILYTGYVSSFEAIETFTRLQFAYYGWQYVPPIQG